MGVIAKTKILTKFVQTVIECSDELMKCKKKSLNTPQTSWFSDPKLFTGTLWISAISMVILCIHT